MTDQPADNLNFACFALAGPSKHADAARLPVRGDLAHVKLAGDVFVPHYAVPMPHRLIATADLHDAARGDAQLLGVIEPGTGFDVLDIAGQWAWGAIAPDDDGKDGLVGYVELVKLERPE